MSAEIFISYARADRDRVLPLVERLREAGVTYWLDEGNIQGAHPLGQGDRRGYPQRQGIGAFRHRGLVRVQKCRQRGRYRL